MVSAMNNPACIRLSNTASSGSKWRARLWALFVVVLCGGNLWSEMQGPLTGLLTGLSVSAYAQGGVIEGQEVESPLENDVASVQSIRTGLVLIDGQYLEPPYRVWREDDHLHINDVQLPLGLEPNFQKRVLEQIQYQQTRWLQRAARRQMQSQWIEAGGADGGDALPLESAEPSTGGTADNQQGDLESTQTGTSRSDQGQGFEDRGARNGWRQSGDLNAEAEFLSEMVRRAVEFPFEAVIEERLLRGEMLVVLSPSTFIFVPQASVAKVVEVLNQVGDEGFESTPQQISRLARQLRSLTDRPVHSSSWRTLLSQFQPNEALTQRVESIEKEMQTRRQRALADKNKPLDEAIQFAIDLAPMLGLTGSVFGIVMVVNMGRQNFKADAASKDWHHVDTTGQRSRTVSRMLLLLIGLNVIDLLFTITAHQTGQFYEANPISRGFLSNPSLLALFKLAMVGIGVTVLWTLRHRRAAEVASWWLCLGYTIVILRWVVVNAHIVG